MARAFTPQDVVQSVTGSAGTTADPGVALSNPATAGHGGVAVIVANTVVQPPEHWDMTSYSGTQSPQLTVMCRADLPDQDQSWPFTAIGGGLANWAWLVEEWTNLSYAPVVAAANAAVAAAPSSISTGSTGTWEGGYAVGIAAVALTRPSGSGAWPSVSWSGGFTETDVVAFGTGAAVGDVQLRVARYYGTFGETGPWSTTATFTGTMTGFNAYACLTAFRAEDQVEVPAASVMTA